MKHGENIAETKLPYDKPKLRVIELVAEEVMGIGCKTGGDVGPLAVCAASGCRDIGS